MSSAARMRHLSSTSRCSVAILCHVIIMDMKDKALITTQHACDVCHVRHGSSQPHLTTALSTAHFMLIAVHEKRVPRTYFTQNLEQRRIKVPSADLLMTRVSSSVLVH